MKYVWVYWILTNYPIAIPDSEPYYTEQICTEARLRVVTSISTEIEKHTKVYNLISGCVSVPVQED